jgi:anti-sigma regulatory factor (Ser/Thr protein kinase)
LSYGGIIFYNNERNLYIFKNDKSSAYSIPARYSIPQRIVEYQPGKMIFFSDDSIRYFTDGKIVRSIPFNRSIVAAEYVNNMVYLAGARSLSVFRIGSKGEIIPVAEKQYPFTIRIFCKTGKHFAITSSNANTYLVDPVTLEIKDNILNNIQVRNVLEDKDGNIWVSSMENGLIKIQQKRISSFTALPELLQNFNALVKTKKIIAGTNQGEIFLYDGLYNIKKIKLGSAENIDAWVRKIVELPSAIYVSSQTGSYLFNGDCSKLLKTFEGPSNRSTKMAFAINDSILCLGNHAQTVRFNIRTGKAIDSIYKRVISLAADHSGKIYIGSNDGLYRWDGDSLYNFGQEEKAFTYRVNAITASPEGLLWVGLGSDSLLVLKDNRKIAAIALGGTVPGNLCKSLFSNKSGEIWLGTNKGLNRIRYQFANNKFSFSNTYFGTADGLIGEQVNDITIKNDTVYVATVGGISYMPANLSLPVSDIATYITAISINNVDTVVAASYDLPYYKNDISISFSGVDLTGFTPLFEYSINNSAWKQTDKIELKRLAPGNYTIKIRAIRRDGAPSAQLATLSLAIKTPFWQDILFWVAVSLVAFTVFVYFLQRSNQQKQKAAINKALTEKKLVELEMQALMSQINPHFIFNCLNSIKGFIYEKDFRQADKYLDKFSDLLRSTLNHAESSFITVKDEIKYLDTYLQLEKLRFDEKFDYEIHADKEVLNEKIHVPAMLLQPYVENAIRHGVRHLENKKGKIDIILKKENGSLVCEIDDNGIGRAKAQDLKKETHIEYQSRGMHLSKRRAGLYGIEQEVIDKKDGDDNAKGTRIVLKIPLTLTAETE